MDDRKDAGADGVTADGRLSLLDLVLPLVQSLRWLIVIPIAVAAAALGLTFLVNPTFTATTTFLPPQQSQGSAASTLASLGAISGLAGLSGGVKTPGDQYVSLLQSVSVTDRIIDAFKLAQVYDEDKRFKVRDELQRNVRVSLGKKDGLITVSVDDESPQRAADMANRYVDELRHISGELALTEAQQRRVFFEHQMKQTRERLTLAQQALEGAGFNSGALRAEPKAAAEGYARLKAEVTAAEVRLRTLEQSFAESTPEVQRQLTMLQALRGQLAKLESNLEVSGGSNYISKYREFKYQEALFEMFSKQYELARVDESREGGLIQVVDVAQVPEHKTRPKRAITAVLTGFAAFVFLALGLMVRHAWRARRNEPDVAVKLERLQAAWRKR